MSSNRSIIKKETIATIGDIGFDLVTENMYTHHIEVYQTSDGIRELQVIPIDPMDCTIAAAISPLVCAALGNDVDTALKALSDTLISKFGAKQFFVLPNAYTMPNFTAIEKSDFKRFRQADVNSLNKTSITLLNKYEKLTAELDKKLICITDEKSFTKDQDEKSRYQALHNMMTHACFTPDKIKEYKSEELQGSMARFKNRFIRPFVLIDEKNNIRGLVRALKMGEKMVYLSDEMIDPSLVSLEMFDGKNGDEKKQMREAYLLAYLMYTACKKNLSDMTHLIVIAAKGRETCYESVGFSAFSMQNNEWHALMHFDEPRSQLLKIQGTIKGITFKKEIKKDTKTKSNTSHKQGFFSPPNRTALNGIFAQQILCNSLVITKKSF